MKLLNFQHCKLVFILSLCVCMRKQRTGVYVIPYQVKTKQNESTGGAGASVKGQLIATY